MNMRNWQASAARQSFSDVVDAAVAGGPQFVQRRDGKQVVVVSREYYDAHKPTLKSHLMSRDVPEMSGEEEAAFDEVMYDITGSPAFAPGHDRSF